MPGVVTRKLSGKGRKGKRDDYFRKKLHIPYNHLGGYKSVLENEMVSDQPILFLKPLFFSWSQSFVDHSIVQIPILFDTWDMYFVMN